MELVGKKAAKLLDTTITWKGSVYFVLTRHEHTNTKTHTHTPINEIRKTTNITYSFFVFCCVRSYPEIAKFSFSPVFLKIPRLPRFSAQLRKMSPRQRLSLKIADPLDYSRQSSYFLVGYYYPRSRLRPVIWRARYADNQRHWRILTRLTVAAVPYGVRCEDCCCSLLWVYGEIPRTPQPWEMQRPTSTGANQWFHKWFSSRQPYALALYLHLSLQGVDESQSKGLPDCVRRRPMSGGCCTSSSRTERFFLNGHLVE